jgi:ATP-dependent DNA helicase DinG
MPDAPALVAGVKEAAWLSSDGEIELLSLAEAARRARQSPPLLCHMRATARRMGVLPFPAFDLLELYAFARPARFCLPTPRGLAAALGLALPQRGVGDEAASLVAAARALLTELRAVAAVDEDLRPIVAAMDRGGWSWGEAALATLGAATAKDGAAGLAVWRKLPEWAEHAPEPPPGNIRYGRRQDLGLHRAGQSLGGEEPGGRVDLHLYPQPPASDRW